MTVGDAARVWGRTDPQFGESLLDSLSRTSLVPQTILFPLSAVAPDPHLRLIGCCLASTRLASSLDPRLPIRPPFCVLRLVATCIHAVPLLSPRLHPMSFVDPRSTSLVVDFGTNSAFVCYTTAWVHLGCRRTLRPYRPYLCFRDLISHPLPIPSSPPHRSLPNHSIRPGRALVHLPCFPRISYALHLSAV